MKKTIVLALTLLAAQSHGIQAIREVPLSDEEYEAFQKKREAYEAYTHRAMDKLWAIAQSSSTNTVHTPPALTNIADCVLQSCGSGEIERAMGDIYTAFGIRIGVEDATMTFDFEPTPVAFTNATLEHVLTSFLSAHTNYVWRYDNRTDMIVIHPEKDSFSMRHYDRIAVTNAPLRSLFNDGNFLGLKEAKGHLALRRMLLWFEPIEVTLDMEDVTAAEVLNAICLQLPASHASWSLRKNKSISGETYILEFFLFGRHQHPQQTP